MNNNLSWLEFEGGVPDYMTKRYTLLCENKDNKYFLYLEPINGRKEISVYENGVIQE